MHLHHLHEHHYNIKAGLMLPTEDRQVMPLSLLFQWFPIILSDLDASASWTGLAISEYLPLFMSLKFLAWEISLVCQQ